MWKFKKYYKKYVEKEQHKSWSIVEVMSVNLLICTEYILCTVIYFLLYNISVSVS